MSDFAEGRQYQRQADAERIAQLEAENAALKAERDAAVSTARIVRSDADDETGVLAAELSIAYNTLATARQSRARLVRLVRALRAELTSAWGIEGQAEQEADAARQSRARLVRLLKGRRKQWNREYHAYLGENDLLEVSNYELEQQRDAARAWSAAWKQAAKMRRARVGYRQDVEWLCVDRRNRRARRAAEAATETQARYWDRILTDEERAELYRAGLDISAAEAMERR